jgi:hypothetical protein
MAEAKAQRAARVHAECQSLGAIRWGARGARSSAVGDEFEHRLRLLLSVADPLEHGADKAAGVASTISNGRCFELRSGSIARRVTSATRCRLPLSAGVTVW